MKNVIRSFEAHKMSWFIFLVFICIIARFIVGTASFLHDFDFRMELLTGEIAASGRNVYAEQKFYNYGPAFFIVLGWFYKVASHFSNNVLAFKCMIVSLLTLADLLTARLIAKKAGLTWGLLFFLNPISIDVGAYNSQFDGLALAFAAYGIYYLEESAERESLSMNDIYGIILLSLSLITKHILWAFPLWILFSGRINSHKKIIYAFIPPLLFLLSFVPYWSEGYQGIINNVFMYRSARNFPLIALSIVEKSFNVSLPFVHNASFLIYVFFISLSGYLFRREKIYNFFLLYTVAMVCFSSGLYNQQFTIPLMAIVIFSQSKSIPAGWLYFFFYFVIRTKVWSNFFGIEHNNITSYYFFSVRCVFMVWCLLFYLVYYYHKQIKHTCS